MQTHMHITCNMDMHVHMHSMHSMRICMHMCM